MAGELRLRGYDSGVKPFAGFRARLLRPLLVRGSYGRVFRAPTLPQLYEGEIDNFVTGLPDLRRPEALTGDPADAATAPRWVRQGGNPSLRPEIGTTKQLGVVLDLPWRRVGNLSLDLTHSEITQDNMIRPNLGAAFIRQNELSGTSDLVQREPGNQTFRNNTSTPIPILAGPAGVTRLVQPGESVTVPGRITMILDSALNLSNQRVRFFDYGARFELQRPAIGRLVASTQWTYYTRHEFRRQAGEAYIPTLARSLPRYRGQSSVTWHRGPWGGNLGMTYIHRYRDLVRDRIEAPRYSTFSAGVSYAFRRDSSLGETHISLGMDNLFDRAPPTDAFIEGYNQGLIARPAGRFGFVALRKTL